jgi:NDP-sugar pyrophosphorylase family protein
MAGKALVERVLEWLRGQGIDDVVLNLHHKPESITAIVGDGAHLGMRVRYSWERQILGSAAGPKLALALWPALNSPCLIVNGDTLTDLSLEPLIEAHRASGARVTMAVIANPRPDHYNGIRADANNTVTGFIPKGHSEPTWHFIGIQVVDPAVFDRLTPGEPAETVSGIYRDLVAESPGAIRVFPTSAPFLDVGTPADYLSAVLDLAGTDVVVEGSATIAPSAVLRRCVVWNGVTIAAGTRLTDSVVLPGLIVPAERPIRL